MIPSLTVSSENQIVGSQSELENRKPIKMQLFLRIEIGLFARLCFRLLVNLFFTQPKSENFSQKSNGKDLPLTVTHAFYMAK